MGLSSVATIAMFGTGYQQLASSGAQQGAVPTPVLTAPGTVHVPSRPAGGPPWELGPVSAAAPASGYAAPVLATAPPVVQLAADVAPVAVPVLTPVLPAAVASGPPQVPAVTARASGPARQPRGHEHPRHQAHRTPVGHPASPPQSQAHSSHGLGQGHARGR